jgi:hypothetical protein
LERDKPKRLAFPLKLRCLLRGTRELVGAGRVVMKAEWEKIKRELRGDTE